MITLALLTGLLVLLTFVTLLRTEVWWVRGCDFPRLQLAVVAAMFVLLDCVLLDFSSVMAWGITLFALSAFVYQLWWFIPYTTFFPVEVACVKSSELVSIDTNNKLSILAANVLTPNKNSAALIKLVREYQPDILVTLETDAWWQAQLDVLEGEYPYTIKCPLANLYGMHVYSKLRLDDAAIQFLVEPEVPSMHALAVLRSGQKVRVHFLHPAPPSPTVFEMSAARDAELLVVAKAVADSPVPVVVAGDLNDVAWSATTRLFRKISGLLDPRVGRGMFNSFHADYRFIRWPLDHIFHSRDFLLSNIQRLPRIGSDHFPMFIELCYSPQVAMLQESLDVTADDQQWAEEKLAAQPVQRVHRPGV
jgi:endonuclease/exonuclease/phosphatase (EEP) superfamily protein YafD